MYLRSVIIDDEESGIGALKLIIERYVTELKVVGEATRVGEGIRLIEEHMPDIVFLDIHMPEMDGFELLEKLGWKNFKLIFTTAHREHALRALKISATDYLLKPIDPVDLRQTIDRIREQSAANRLTATTYEYAPLNSIQMYRTNKLAVNSKDSVEFIDPLEITVLESKSNYTLIHLDTSRTILTPKTLGEFEAQLCDLTLNFMRVHNSFIVNLHKVSRYHKDDNKIILSDANKIPLAKSRRDSFLRWLLHLKAI